MKSDAEDDPQIRVCPVVNARVGTVHVSLTVLQDEVPRGWLPEQHARCSEAGRMLSPEHSYYMTVREHSGRREPEADDAGM